MTGELMALGTPAPEVVLPEVVDGTTVEVGELEGRALVVAFLSRHCPYVKHVQAELAAVAEAYAEQGVAFVGIAANDPTTHPDDAPEWLAEQKREVGFGFPYLFDGSQQVAHAFGAVCTPDLFVFDGDRRLAYRGRFDATRPGRGEPDGADLRAALDAVLDGREVAGEQHPPLGCSIKWRAGNEPATPGVPRSG
jgi:peroxiredoxin